MKRDPRLERTQKQRNRIRKKRDHAIDLCMEVEPRNSEAEQRERKNVDRRVDEPRRGKERERERVNPKKKRRRRKEGRAWNKLVRTSVVEYLSTGRTRRAKQRQIDRNQDRRRTRPQTKALTEIVIPPSQTHPTSPSSQVSLASKPSSPPPPNQPLHLPRPTPAIVLSRSSSLPPLHPSPTLLSTQARRRRPFDA